jgi:isopentenyl-diphosphate delta-isomerase
MKMKKVTRISKRKTDHININLNEDVQSGISTGLEKYQFIHEALPEIDLLDVRTHIEIFGKNLSSPILISSMTGGSPESEIINIRLAQAAQEKKIALGVGSQRAALESPALSKSFDVRKYAPDILLFGNIGAIQLNNGYKTDDCKRAIDMIEADGLILHLNPLQEALQSGGDTNFKGLINNIETICKNISVPIIAKEVGWGISERTTRMLLNSGISAIDVAGAGGTSWSQVEMFDAESEYYRQLALTYKYWGLTTSKSILNVKNAAPDLPIFASGGLINGLDMAKCIALGASLAGSAGIFLKVATISTDRVIELIKLFQNQITISMFASGSVELSDLKNKLFVCE